MSLSSGERQLYRIYALVDPLTGDPHYVGQTAATLADRRREHVRKPGSTKKGHGSANYLTTVVNRGSF